jgi:hypothetical protein
VCCADPAAKAAYDAAVAMIQTTSCGAAGFNQVQGPEQPRDGSAAAAASATSGQQSFWQMLNILWAGHRRFETDRVAVCDEECGCSTCKPGVHCATNPIWTVHSAHTAAPAVSRSAPLMMLACLPCILQVVAYCMRLCCRPAPAAHRNAADRQRLCDAGQDVCGTGEDRAGRRQLGQRLVMSSHVMSCHVGLLLPHQRCGLHCQACWLRDCWCTLRQYCA